MKYIRTEDRRIIVTGEGEIGYKLGTFEVHNKAGIVAFYEPIKVLKIANTIEELCDEFVYEYNDELPLIRYRETGKPTLSVLYENMKHSNHITNIYGAIWTNKGLIYVAKMNEKGELELL